MKKILLCIVALVQMLTASAEFVTEQQAREKAAAFLSRQSEVSHAKGKATSSVSAASLVMVSQAAINAAKAKATASQAKTVASTGSTTTVDTNSQPCYYIFNKADSTGFVIVSAESTTVQILAYSNEGYFHVEDIDKGAEVFLSQYEKDVQTARTQGLTAEQQAYVEKLNAASVTDVEGKELETANLNQYDGYWDSYSPYSSGKDYAPSGCVATAAAIIMKYHGWPAQGKGCNSYVSETHQLSLSRDFSKDTYDWSIIPTEAFSYYYTSREWTPAAQKEIAKILLACGIACNMDYDISGSSAVAEYMRVAMVQNFSYASNYVEYNATRNTDGTYTWTDEAWATASAAAKSSLDNNMPVMVSGLSSYGGHCFVIDGYDIDGIFRYNMGWGGFNNGYYANGSISADNYSLYQFATNIHPQKGEVLASGTMGTSVNYRLVDDGVLTISGTGTIPRDCTTGIKSNFTDIKIEEGITSFADYAFWNLLGLYSITIPSTVKTMGKGSLSYCYRLKTIVCKAVTPPTLGSAIMSAASTLKVYIPAESKSAYQSATYWSSWKDNIVAQGDLDGVDGPSVGDVTALKDIVTGDSEYSIAADVNNDGEITVADITQMIKKVNNR